MRKEMTFKSYLLSQIVGKKLRFTCNCSIPVDVTGVVNSFKITGNDAVIYITRESDKKLVPITLNHPQMMVEEIKK